MLSGHSRHRAGTLLLVLTLSVAGVAADSDRPGTAAGPDTDHQTAEPLEDEVDALERHVQGMADKLKESAAARRGAEQARMEAERKLAEVAQQNRALNAELCLLRDARLALETAGDRAREREMKTRAALDQARESIAHLNAQRDAQDQRIVELAQGIATLEAERRADRTRIQRLQVQLEAAGNEHDNLARRLDAMRSLVPAAEGGSLTLDEARSRAAEAAAALRAAVESAATSSRAQGRRGQRNAEQEMHRRQFTVARVSGARSVYRVRPRDSLGLVARRLYGDSERWREISEANRHVLPDPDHLTPGMTLVVP